MQKSNHLKYTYTNACSLENNQEELELCAQIESYDIVGVSETRWDHSLDWTIVMAGCGLFCKDMRARTGGGDTLTQEPWQLWKPYQMPLWKDQKGHFQEESYSGNLLLAPNQDNKAKNTILFQQAFRSTEPDSYGWLQLPRNLLEEQ